MMMTIYLLNSDARNIPLADRSVQCIITSPPYYGLRDYGIPNQIGLERTPQEYVTSIVAVMRECWRVLKDDGVLWLNIGDSYARQAGSDYNKKTDSGMKTGRTGREKELFRQGNNKPPDGLKEKDLIGIPWRCAFALQDDGWYLRSDIIWSKPNPMPESVTDRPTKAHEYIFLLTKRARYYYDAAAIQEQSIYPDDNRKSRSDIDDKRMPTDVIAGIRPGSAIYPTRNRRSVWTVATTPYSGAHFATFPPKLIEPMILAGTSNKGECPHCGKAWIRVDPNEVGVQWQPQCECHGKIVKRKTWVDFGAGREYRTFDEFIPNGGMTIDDVPVSPQLVLDPFAGTATVGRVAIKHQRRFVGLDLNLKYIGDLAKERTSKVQTYMQFATEL